MLAIWLHAKDHTTGLPLLVTFSCLHRSVHGIMAVFMPCCSVLWGWSCISTLELTGAIGRQHTDRASPLLQQITERRKIQILYGKLSNKE